MGEKFHRPAFYILAILAFCSLCLALAAYKRAASAEEKLRNFGGRDIFATTAESGHERAGKREITGRVILSDAAGFIRNKNPLNIRSGESGSQWPGQIGQDRSGYAVFESFEDGFRAAAFLLSTYEREHRISTLRELASLLRAGAREACAEFLGERMDLDPDEEFLLTSRLSELLRHMAHFETGQTWPDRYFLPYDITAKLSADNRSRS